METADSMHHVFFAVTENQRAVPGLLDLLSCASQYVSGLSD